MTKVVFFSHLTMTKFVNILAHLPEELKMNRLK